MQNSWKEAKLGDISTMKFGRVPKGQKCDIRRIENNEEYIYPEPELIVVARGKANTGDVKISKPHSFIENTSIVVKLNENIADKRFYYYYLQARDLRSMCNNANVSRITISDLKKCSVKIPPLLEQKKIGSILSTLDSKIKGNREVSKSLEDIAQSIYKHWFIDFEFPDDEFESYKSMGGEFVKTKWGLLPKGWRVGKYTDIVDVIIGTTPKNTTREYWDGKIPLFTPGDAEMQTYVLKTEKTITNLGLKRSGGILYPVDTVFVTARGTIGKVNINAVPMAVNRGCYALQGKNDVGTYYIYMLTKNCQEKLLKASHGAVLKTIDNETFDSMNIIIPPESVIKEFENTVAPIFTKMRQLVLTNKALRELRDGLLPKLTSGEMRVV